MESNILYQRGKHWVCRAKKGGFEVYRAEGTHSVRCAQIGYKGTKGLIRAINEVDRREELVHG